MCPDTTMKKKVKISIYSFGYSFSGIPKDPNGNNGGFVFDCRFLPNPYFEPELKECNGLTKELKTYFAEKKECQDFLSDISKILEASIKVYEEKGYENLYVAFGCTGGFHRSVYCSQQIFERFKSKDYKVSVKHLELEK